MRKYDLLGQRFGRLTVLGSARKPNGTWVWRCQCECGNEAMVPSSDLRSGKTQSCGCGAGRCTHGLSRGPDGKHTALYKVWTQMRQRCLNPSNRSYPRYGGRGIRVCDEWQDYSVFHAWALSNGYEQGLTIERMDNDAGYCPENCTWIPLSQQALNLAKSRRVTHKGTTRHLREWGRVTGINARTIAGRIDSGWPIDKALTEPIRRAHVGVAANG